MATKRREFLKTTALAGIASMISPELVLSYVGNGNNTSFDGIYISGYGDSEYLALLDKAYTMIRPNPYMENLSMLYHPEWNGFVEGPTWGAWWIQNSFGPTYTMLPFMDKAYQTFVLNSQDLWFRFIGDGVRKGANGGYVAPVGSLCDCASPKGVNYRQGDGKVDKHDWGFGFTAAGIILQSELLLIRRNREDIDHYLPMLELCAEFIDSRRDPVNNMFLVGPAANLLAPSYAGTGKLLADGSYGKAYLSEISINYIAGLNRLIELEKMAENNDKVRLYTDRIELIRKGLANFRTPEGYFIRSIDPDGTKHGVYKNAVHGYFETSPNCDAMAFRISDDTQSKQIYNTIKSIPQLRPNKVIIPNYPAYDDMYEYDGIFNYGVWVNGGAWTTVEARMQMGYYRVGAYQDARAAFEKILNLSTDFRLDNPLADFGSKISQTGEAVNCVYDCWGAPGGFLRGLFEFIYTAEGLELFPHIPPGITTLQQKFPVYFGNKEIYISVSGSGNISSVNVNGQSLNKFTEQSVFLSMDERPETVYIAIGLGGKAIAKPEKKKIQEFKAISSLPVADDHWDIDSLRDPDDLFSRKTPESVLDNLKKIPGFHRILVESGLEESYEAKHAFLILDAVRAIYERRELKEQKKLKLLGQKSQWEADNLFISTVEKLTNGLSHHLENCRKSSKKAERNMYTFWMNT